MSTDQIAKITKAGLDRMERELEQRQAGPLTPHVHPDTIHDLNRRIGDIEQHIRDQGALPAATETVYAHVERTVHALLEEISRRVDESDDENEADPEAIKTLAEAAQALSAWPQFNPMNAVDDYRKIAEYEVESAIRKQGVRISGGTTDSERWDAAAAFDAVFSKLTALGDRIAKIEGNF